MNTRNSLGLLTWIIFTLACIIPPGCGGRQATPVPGAPQALINALPPLPAGKSAAEPVDTIIPGAATYLSENTSTSLDSLVLQSADGTSAWGIWQLAVGSSGSPSVQIEVLEPGGDLYWIGVSNYASGSWDFSGPFVSNKLIALSTADNVALSGNCYVAAVAYGGAALTITQLVLHLDRQGWQLVTVDDDGDAGAYSSLALIDGHPAISYQQHNGSDTLSQRYVRSRSATGAAPSDWNEIVTLDTSPSVHHTFGDSALAEIDGNPAIVYSLYNHSTGITERKYARSATATGNLAGDWEGFVVFESDSTRDIYNALAEVDGNPAICYFHVEPDGDDYHHNIVYLRSTTSTGVAPADWSQMTLLDTALKSGSYFDIGWQISLTLIGGNPAVSYTQGFLTGAVKYVRATTSSGANPLDWPAPVTVDSGNTFFYASLAEVDGNPALCYFDNTDGALKYVRSTTPTGGNAADWSGKILLNALGNPGQYNSLAVIGGNPAISYLGNPDLHYLRATNTTGATAGDWLASPQIVDNAPGAGRYTSLAEVDGKPAISYYNGSSEQLMYAILFQ